MITVFEVLYNYASNSPDLNRWLRDEDTLRDYADSGKFAQEQASQLMNCLTGEERTLFEKYMGNIEEHWSMRNYMLFCQGLAMGLQLGLSAHS